MNMSLDLINNNNIPQSIGIGLICVGIGLVGYGIYSYLIDNHWNDDIDNESIASEHTVSDGAVSDVTVTMSQANRVDIGIQTIDNVANDVATQTILESNEVGIQAMSESVIDITRVHHVGIQTSTFSIDEIVQTSDNDIKTLTDMATETNNLGINVSTQTHNLGHYLNNSVQTSEDLLYQAFGSIDPLVYQAYQDLIAEANSVDIAVQTEDINHLLHRPTNTDIGIQSDDLASASNVDVNISIHDDIIHDLMQAANTMNIRVDKMDIFNSIKELIDNGSMSNQASSLSIISPESFHRTYISNEWYQQNKTSILNWINNQSSNPVSSASADSFGLQSDISTPLPLSRFTNQLNDAVLTDSRADNLNIDSLNINDLNQIDNFINNIFPDYQLDHELVRDLVDNSDLTNSMQEIFIFIINLLMTFR
jgi:hypothetical protein